MSITATTPATVFPKHATARHHRGAGRIFLRTLSTAAAILATVVASLAIVVAIAAHFSPKGEYVIFGHPVMSVLSGSMSPVIRTGDLVIDDPVTAAQAEHLQVGQIVSFREGADSNKVITHRIVAVKDQGGSVSYVTKGDANNAADATLRPASDVVGVVRLDVHRGGYILANLHRPLVLGLLGASLVLGFTAGPIFRLARRSAQADQELTKS